MKPKPFCITESFARAILLGLEKPLHLSPSIELVAVMSEHDGRELASGSTQRGPYRSGPAHRNMPPRRFVFLAPFK